MIMNDGEEGLLSQWQVVNKDLDMATRMSYWRILMGFWLGALLVPIRCLGESEKQLLKICQIPAKKVRKKDNKVFSCIFGFQDACVYKVN